MDLIDLDNEDSSKVASPRNFEWKEYKFKKSTDFSREGFKTRDLTVDAESGTLGASPEIQEIRRHAQPYFPTEVTRTEILEKINAKVIGISDKHNFASIIFARPEGPVTYDIPLNSLHNAGLMNPKEGQDIVFSVCKVGNDYLGRFSYSKAISESPVSENELKLLPSVEELEQFLKRAEGDDTK